MFLFILFIDSLPCGRPAEAGLTRTLHYHDYKYQTYKNNKQWQIAHAE